MFKAIINGKLLNEITECTVSSGFVGIQSEGADFEIRKIYLQPLLIRTSTVIANAAMHSGSSNKLEKNSVSAFVNFNSLLQNLFFHPRLRLDRRF